ASISKVVHLPVTPYSIRGDLGGYLYYEVSEPSGALWRTDGTAAGTFAYSSDIRNVNSLAAFKRTAWFTSGETLYRVDRTTGQPIASMEVPYPTSVISLGDKLLLERNDTLYVSD